MRERWKTGCLLLALVLFIGFAGEKPLFAKEKEELAPVEIYENCSGAVVEITIYDDFGGSDVGAGFFIGDGMVLTNFHVIDRASRIAVKDKSGKSYSVKRLFAYDEKSDLAVLGVSKGNPASLILDYGELHTGDTIYTIGSPLKYTGSFSDGIISFASRIMDDVNYIQFSAATSKGSGGGPILNQYGEVIGINTLTVNTAQNINFAVPAAYYLALDLSSPIPIKNYYRENKGKHLGPDLVINIG